jgi:hypothetical protein
MLAAIDPTALPALRIAGTFFLVINILAFIYIFRNRHRFFGRIQMYRTTFRFVDYESRWFWSRGSF